MRWIVLGLAALVIAACSQASNLHSQIIWTGGVGYDVRAVTVAGGLPTYEASAAYTAAHTKERPQIIRNLLYRGISKVKSDGYDYVMVQGANNATLTSTTYRNGVQIASSSNPGIRVRLVGYKAGAPHPPGATEAAAWLNRLKAEGTEG
jgi:hypothetical protein